MPAHVLNDIKSGKYHGGELDPGEYDAGNKGKRLLDFVDHQHSQDSKISECNALAARLYTTSSYKRFNVPLRKHEDDIPHPVPHPFKMTVYYLDEGLRAMRTIAAQENPKKFSQDRRLYRGMKGMTIFNSDGRPVEALEVGGIERAPMSTTVQRHTAASYAGALSEKVCMCVCVCVSLRVFNPLCLLHSSSEWLTIYLRGSVSLSPVGRQQST